ncbi:MAG: beta-lactamase family protein [Candidatus Schekmanbacteria bacterium]|nr:beta-lactamase family protein [Candidatus Schekmanbacteria bacterium]
MSRFSGMIHDDFLPVARALCKMVRRPEDGGAAVCVYHRGEKVVDIWAGNRNAEGTPWAEDTAALSFSTTKGVTSAAVHLLADRGLISYDDPVSRYWPEFAAAGKRELTIRHVLCHESGLFDIGSLVSDSREMLDWGHICRLLAASEPRFRPGTANGYQAITYGWLAGEIVRRVTGVPIERFVASEIAEPLRADGLCLLVPAEQRRRLATLINPLAVRSRFGAERTLSERYRRADRLMSRLPRWTRCALTPRGILPFVFSDEVLDAPIPSLNGVFTARSLAKLYAAIVSGGARDLPRLFSDSTARSLGVAQNRRRDKVLFIPMYWRLGYHFVGTNRGVVRGAFGHFGYGGSGAWGDLRSELAVALVVNRVAGTPIGDTRMLRIGGAALACANKRSQALVKA